MASEREHHRWMKAGWCSGIALALVLLLTGCGSPDPETKEFVFTPVPYEVVISETGERVHVSVSQHESGYRYRVDQVLVSLDIGREEEFTEWAASWGFDVSVNVRPERLGFVQLIVKVPAGSADDAIRLIQEHQDVLEVTPDRLFPLAEDER